MGAVLPLQLPRFLGGVAHKEVSLHGWIQALSKQNIHRSRLLKNSISGERSSSCTYQVNVGCLLKSILTHLGDLIHSAGHLRKTAPSSRPDRTHSTRPLVSNCQMAMF